jgi:hypothetical protein
MMLSQHGVDAINLSLELRPGANPVLAAMQKPKGKMPNR